ncbi:hypothetical protein [Haloimpatiens massiliensis]|uniref:hypothetical protein n=1 Tax=Haloimpatiens massiliensis TaxID=1658110 RepID=UPI000C83FD28|nr:hypothetical protein [Haloimpatiens massiliensis]
MVNTIDIKNIEWSKNTADVGETVLIKITISKIITDTVQSSQYSLCGEIISGQQVKSELVFKP